MSAKTCPKCGATYEPTFSFCTNDGTPLVAAPGAAPGAAPVAAPSPSVRPLHLGIGVAVLVVGLAAVLGWAATREPEAVRRAWAALEAGDLVEPAGASAYDWYRTLGAEAPGDPRLAEIAAAARPVVARRLETFYDAFYATSDARPSEWPGVARLAAWATELDPGDPALEAQALYARGRVAMADGDFGEAARLFGAAADARPDWALPVNSLGVLRVREGNLAAAAAAYRRAGALDPSWRIPPANLGGTYMRMERYGSAAAALRRTLDLDPDQPYSQYLLSEALLEVRDYRGARRAAQRALEFDPTGASGFDDGRLRERVRYLGEYVDTYAGTSVSYQEYVSARKRGYSPY